MEDRKKELQNLIKSYWISYIKFQARSESIQAEADYYKKLHDIAERELEDLEKYGND